jgi:hypothetical protein
LKTRLVHPVNRTVSSKTAVGRVRAGLRFYAELFVGGILPVGAILQGSMALVFRHPESVRPGPDDRHSVPVVLISGR